MIESIFILITLFYVFMFLSLGYIFCKFPGAYLLKILGISFFDESSTIKG